MDGFTQALIHESPQGGQVFRQRFSAATSLPLHGHPFGEHIIVLRGRIRVGDVELGVGHHFWTPPGTRHEAAALEETELIVIVPPPRA